MCFCTLSVHFRQVIIANEMTHSMKHKNSGRDEFVGFKLDMSKAYDRIEWPYIEKL